MNTDKWLDFCGMFYEGSARVRLDGKWNYIDKKGKYLSDVWFDGCDAFHEDRVKLNGEWLYIDKEGGLHEHR